MKILIILAAFTALTSAAVWNNLRVTWNPLVLLKLSSLYEIPRTMDDATSEGWVTVEGVNDHNVSVQCFPGDGRFCILTDSYGHIAGVQVSVLATDMENNGIPYDPSTISMFKKKTMFEEDYWTTTVYTVDPDVIDAGGREDMEGLTGTTGVWIEQGDSLLFASRNVTTMAKDTGFLRQNCIPSMGLHYYYAMNSSLRCEESLPYFLLYDDGDMVGIGFKGVGQPTTKDRSWFEYTPTFAMQATLPDPPTCLIENSNEFGLYSLHIFFIEKPWNLGCPVLEFLDQYF